MERGLAEKKEATKDAEEELKSVIRGVTYRHIEKFQEKPKNGVSCYTFRSH